MYKTACMYGGVSMFDKYLRLLIASMFDTVGHQIECK